MLSTKYALAGLIAASMLIAPAVTALEPAGASPAQPGPAAAESTLDIPEAELHDLEVIAEQEGISVAQAYAKFGWGQAFSDAVARVAEDFPDDFVTSRMNVNGHIGGMVVFAQEAPAGVESYFTDLGVPVNIVEKRGVPQAAMRRVVENVHYQSRAMAGEADVFTEAEEETGDVTVTVTPGSARGRSASAGEIRAAAQDRAVAMLPDFRGRVSVTVREDENGRGEPETIRGGAILNYPLSGNLACTSAWPVASTSGTGEGLITARHCDNDLEYTDRDVLTWVRSLPPNRGDMQFMRSSESVGHAFYYAVGEYRDIDAPLGTPSNDQYLCFFGRKTGNHCDNVRDTYVCANDYCNLVSMDDHDTAGGDSGGPWYYGSRPYGVHHGYHTSWFKERALWTPIYNTIADISVRIKVGADG